MKHNNSNNNTIEQSQKADARIVQAVRNLKSTKNTITPLNQGQDSTNDEVPSNQIQNLNNNFNKDIIENDKQSIHSSNTNTNLVHVHGSNKHLTKKIESSRISIDGEKINNYNGTKTKIDRRGTARLPSSKITLIDNLRKPKTVYQKNILSEANLIKHKQTCYNLLKTDSDLKKLIGNLKILEEQYNDILQEQLFANKTFLFKLEMIILNDMNENSSHNKIHSVNKGKTTSFKVIREKFFKEAIQMILQTKWYDIQFEEKSKKMNVYITQHIEDIMNFDL